MKIVVIIGNTSEPFKYFANTINAKQKVDLLLVENPRSLNSSGKKLNVPEPRYGLIEKTLRYILFKLKMRRKKGLKAQEESFYKQACKRWFGSEFTELNKGMATVFVDDINSVDTQKIIAQIDPDLMLVHGSTLLKTEVTDLAKLALNLHWGLSPYYRGVNCTNQALLNWDILNIGVTIHKLANKIDGGDILGQSRAKISNMADLKSATLQLTFLGTEIVLKAIEMLDKRKNLAFVKQDYSLGFLTKGLHWNENTVNFIESIDDQLLDKMLKHPVRREVSIVELA